MLLYHYSKQPHSELLTLLQQGITAERKLQLEQLSKERGSLYPYYDSISFFMEPMPMDVLGTVFSESHPVWVNGNVLYEHVVDTSTLDLKYWTVVEGKIDDLLSPFWSDLPVVKKLHGKTKHFIKRLFNENGISTDSLHRAILKYAGQLRPALFKTDRQYSKQYAADIPHLMVYPTTHIRVGKVFEVVVGSQVRKPISVN